MVPQMAVIGFVSLETLIVSLLGQLDNNMLYGQSIGYRRLWSLGAAFVERSLGWRTHDSGMIAMEGPRRCREIYI